MNWKALVANWVLFIGLPILGSVATWFSFRLHRLDRLARGHWLGLAVALFLVTRVGTHFLAFHLFHYAGTNDLLKGWLPMARAVLDGRDPGLYADNAYGPLFPYVLAFGLWLWGGSYVAGINTGFVLADAATLCLLFDLARRTFDEATARRLTLIVLLSPLLWHSVTISSQDEPLFLMFLLGVLCLLTRRCYFFAVVAVTIGTLFTKATFPFWALPVLLAPRDGAGSTMRRLAGMGVLILLSFVVLHSLGWQLWGRYAYVGVAGMSSWRLVLLGHQPSAGWFRAGAAATALVAAAVALVAVRERDGETEADRAARGVVAVQGAYFLFSPFSLTFHMLQGMPFLAWQAIRAEATVSRPGTAATALAFAYCLWQGAALVIDNLRWQPLIIGAFLGYCGWTAWLAVRGSLELPQFHGHRG